MSLTYVTRSSSFVAPLCVMRSTMHVRLTYLSLAAGAQLYLHSLPTVPWATLWSRLVHCWRSSSDLETSRRTNRLTKTVYAALFRNFCASDHTSAFAILSAQAKYGLDKILSRLA
jgi:hypothetical protein